MRVIDLTFAGLGIHEELVAYVADQQDYYQQEGVHVALRDGRAWDDERVRHNATIGRYVAPYFTTDGRHDPSIAAQGLSSVAQELGVSAVPDEADIYRTDPAEASAV